MTQEVASTYPTYSEDMSNSQRMFYRQRIIDFLGVYAKGMGYPAVEQHVGLINSIADSDPTIVRAIDDLPARIMAVTPDPDKHVLYSDQSEPLPYLRVKTLDFARGKIWVVGQVRGSELEAKLLEELGYHLRMSSIYFPQSSN